MDYLNQFLVTIGQNYAYIKYNPCGAEVRSDGSTLWTVIITVNIDPQSLPEIYEQNKNEYWTVQETFSYWIKTNEDSIDKDVNYIKNKAAADMYGLLTTDEGKLDLEYVRKWAAE
jgi:hypothetical protein